MWLEETVSPSTATSSTTRTSNRGRGRGSTSGSGVTLTRRGSLRGGRLGQAGQGLLEREQRPPVGRLDAERTDGRAPERLAVGVAQVGDQAAHVGPGRALDLQLHP